VDKFEFAEILAQSIKALPETRKVEFEEADGSITVKIGSKTFVVNVKEV